MEETRAPLDSPPTIQAIEPSAATQAFETGT